MDIQSFALQIAGRLQAAGYTVKMDDEAMLVVSFSSDTHSKINMHNFFVRHQHGEQMDHIVNIILKVMKDTVAQHQPLSWQTARDKLRIHLVTHGSIEKGIVKRPVSPIMTEILVVDEPEYIRYVIDRDVEAMGKDEGDLWLAAEFNMLTRAPEPQKSTPPGYSTLHVWDCQFGANWAWRWAMKQPIAAVATVQRDFGISVVLPSQADIERLAIFTSKASERPLAYPLTSCVHIVANGEVIGGIGATQVSSE